MNPCWNTKRTAIQILWFPRQSGNIEKEWIGISKIHVLMIPCWSSKLPCIQIAAYRHLLLFEFSQNRQPILIDFFLQHHAPWIILPRSFISMSPRWSTKLRNIHISQASQQPVFIAMILCYVPIAHRKGKGVQFRSLVAPPKNIVLMNFPWSTKCAILCLVRFYNLPFRLHFILKPMREHAKLRVSLTPSLTDERACPIERVLLFSPSLTVVQLADGGRDVRRLVVVVDRTEELQRRGLEGIRKSNRDTGDTVAWLPEVMPEVDTAL